MSRRASLKHSSSVQVETFVFWEALYARISIQTETRERFRLRPLRL